MNIFRSLINRFKTNYPKNPNEFVKKFIEDSNNSRAQLEMIYNGNKILQVDPLKFVPSWFKVVKVNEKKYQNGYVLFFVQERNDFIVNGMAEKLKSKEIKGVHTIDEYHGDELVVTVAKFTPKMKDYLSLAIEIRNFIDSFYDFKEKNPSILFNIRYLDNLKG